MSGTTVTFPVPVTQIPSCWVENIPLKDGVAVVVQPLKKTVVSTNAKPMAKNQLFFIIPPFLDFLYI
jgi:hypothetical protein